MDNDDGKGWLPPAMVASLEARGIDPYATLSADASQQTAEGTVENAIRELTHREWEWLGAWRIKKTNDVLSEHRAYRDRLEAASAVDTARESLIAAVRAATLADVERALIAQDATRVIDLADALTAIRALAP